MEILLVILKLLGEGKVMQNRDGLSAYIIIDSDYTQLISNISCCRLYDCYSFLYIYYYFVTV